MSRPRAYSPRPRGRWNGSALQFALMMTVAVACYGGDLVLAACESAAGVICVAKEGTPTDSGECPRLGYPLEMYPGSFFRPPPVRLPSPGQAVMP